MGKIPLIDDFNNRVSHVQFEVICITVMSIPTLFPKFPCNIECGNQEKGMMWSMCFGIQALITGSPDAHVENGPKDDPMLMNLQLHPSIHQGILRNLEDIELSLLDEVSS